jgi:hypothetical protein
MNAEALAAARARCAASRQRMLAVRSLEYLPDNLLTALLLLLPAHGRARCALLNKRWRTLARSPAAWRTIIIAEGAHDATTLTAILQLAGGGLQHLRFLFGSGRSYQRPSFPAPAVVAAALQGAACAQLTELSFVPPPAAVADADEPSAHTRLAPACAQGDLDIDT